MRNMQIVRKLILDHYVRNGLLIFLVSILVCLIFASMYQFNEYQKIIQAGYDYELNHAIVYSCVTQGYENTYDIQKEILDVDGVASCIVDYEEYSFGDPVMQDGYVLSRYVPEFYAGVKPNLSEGTWPSDDTTNNIILTDKFRSWYQVGDVINVDCALSHSESIKVNLRVAGFLDNDDYFYFCTGASEKPNLSNYITRISELPYKDMWHGIIVGSLVDSSGKVIDPPYYRISFLIRAEKGSSTVDLKERLIGILPDHQTLFTFDELVRGYYSVFSEQMKETILPGTIVVLLLITTIISSTFLAIVSQTRELSIYYLCGATWRRCLAIFCLAQLMVLVLGTILGFGTYLSLAYLNNISEPINLFGILSILLSLLITFAISFTPFYILTRKVSPMQLLRKD